MKGSFVGILVQRVFVPAHVVVLDVVLLIVVDIIRIAFVGSLISFEGVLDAVDILLEYVSTCIIIVQVKTYIVHLVFLGMSKLQKN